MVVRLVSWLKTLMMVSLKADLMKRGVPEDQIYHEEFGFS